MQRNIFVTEAEIKNEEVELVERKGIGHPDTLTDGIMEEISCELSKEYIKDYGCIVHHNVDKGLICGGSTEVSFGGGKFIKPIEIILAGRAIDLKKRNVGELAIETAKKFLKEKTRYLDVDDAGQLIFQTKIARGSADLVELFGRIKGIPLANDTSFGIGFAPFTKLEKTVMGIEKFLNSAEFKRRYPAVGEDIKVMGMKEKKNTRITVAMAMVSRHVSSLAEYKEIIEKVRGEILKKFPGIELYVNAADDYQKNSVYITLTGLSAEMGDDGSVGRGNRANGLITPSRPMTLEATAGKNPVNHVGKIYTVGAFEIAKEIAKLDGVANADVYLLSQIGNPIDQPKSASVDLAFKTNLNGDEKQKLLKEAWGIVDSQLGSITELTNKIIEKKVGVYY